MAPIVRSRWSSAPPGRMERVLTGTLETIEAQLAVDPIDRTAIIFVGRGLAAEDFRESSLYDAHYQRRFRGREDVSDSAINNAVTPGRQALARLNFKPRQLEPGQSGSPAPARASRLPDAGGAGCPRQGDALVYDALVSARRRRRRRGARTASTPASAAANRRSSRTTSPLCSCGWRARAAASSG